MKILKQLGIIFGILFASHIIQSITDIPVPSTVLGMFILLALLLMGIVKVEMIEDMANFFLKHMTLFFIPAGVGIMTQLNIIKKEWLGFLTIVLVTTILVMISTGFTTQALLKFKKEDK